MAEDPLVAAYQGLMRENLLVLQQKVEELNEMDRSLREGLEALRLTGQRCIVSLSLGWLVETNQQEAQEIIERKQERNFRQLDGTKMMLTDCERKLETLDSLVASQSDHVVNEEGLPMIEIREEVDDTGNEVSSRVVAASEMSSISSTLQNLHVQDTSPSKVPLEISPEQPTRPHINNQSVAVEKSAPQVQIENESAGDLDEFDDFDELQKSTIPQSSADTMQSLVEMENIIGEFELDEIEEFDEFEDGDDFDEETDEDEDEFGRTRGSLVPVDLLQHRYSNLNSANAKEADTKGQKQVRFSDSLDIQNTASQPPTPQKIETRAVEDIRPKQAAPKPTGVMSDEIVERNVKSSEDDPMAQYEIDPVIHRQEVATEYHQLRSKFIQQQGGYIKPDEERAIEPIEEPVQKVSRFKAAKLAFKES